MTSPISKSKLSSSSEMDACIVCGVFDTRVSRCCGAECLVWFHGECLVGFGGSHDLSNPFCPYCWYKFVLMKSNPLQEESIQAKKALLKYRDKDAEDNDETAKVDACVDVSRVVLNDGTDSESVDMEEDEVVASGEEERVAMDDETADVGTRVDTCVVEKRDVSRFLSVGESYAGKEHEQVQLNDNRRRRKQVEMSDDTDGNSGDMREDKVVASGEQGHEDETAIVQSKVKSGAVESYAGKEHEQVLQKEKQGRKMLVKKGDVSRLSSLQESVPVLENEKQSGIESNDDTDSESGDMEVVASGEQKRLSIQDVEDDDETELYSGEEDDMVQQHENQSCSSRRRRRIVISDSESRDKEAHEVVASGEKKRVSIENVQDVEDDDETESYSGEEHDMVQQHENQSCSSKRRRRIVISDDDSEDEISASEEQNGQDVTEQTTSNQPRKVTTREASFFNKGLKRRILWTPEEEEKLKKGVEKFGAEARRNMPWQKILIWGEHVFDKDREPSNLKDKWKNMIKNEQKEQKEQ